MELTEGHYRLSSPIRILIPLETRILFRKMTERAEVCRRQKSELRRESCFLLTEESFLGSDFTQSLDLSKLNNIF